MGVIDHIRLKTGLIVNVFDSYGRIGLSWITHGTVARVGARPHRRRTGDLHFDRVAFHSFELFLFLSVSYALFEGLEVGLVRGAGDGGLRAGVEGCVGFSDGDGRGLGGAERHGVHVLSHHEYSRKTDQKQAPDEFVKIRTKTREKANECEMSTANCKCAEGDTGLPMDDAAAISPGVQSKLRGP